MKTTTYAHEGKFSRVEGLTHSTFKTGYTVGFSHLVYKASRQACMRANTVRVKIAYTPVIYIQKAATPGSCRYNIALGHEQQHVAIDLATIREFVPRVKERVRAALSVPSTRTIPERDMEGWQENISETVSRAVESEMQAFNKTRMARHAKLDSHEEYMRLSKACKR